MSDLLWQPSTERIDQANLTAFMRAVERDWGQSSPTTRRCISVH
jgi:hypothetical protein